MYVIFTDGLIGSVFIISSVFIIILVLFSYLDVEPIYLAGKFSSPAFLMKRNLMKVHAKQINIPFGIQSSLFPHRLMQDLSDIGNLQCHENEHF